MKLKKNKIGLYLGPLLYLIISFSTIEGLSDQGKAILASALWIAIWWITDAISLVVTALLPIVLFPVSGGLSLTETTSAYGHPYIFLFLGGFILAIAIEKWHLHRRIALQIIKTVGTDISTIILGFMISTAFLSMWISNTACAVMILPVGIAIVKQLKDNPKTIENENEIFAKALMLAIAYAASIGGLATLIGTPPNLVLIGVVKESYGIEISFFQWFMFGFPICLVLLLITWIYLTKFAFKFNQKEFPGGMDEINAQLKSLGKISFEEKWILVVFVLTALAWITRSFLITPFIPGVDDSVIAIISCITLFLLPSQKKSKPLLEWKDTLHLPWGILLLFGGGLALAVGFEKSGLALWIGQHLMILQHVHLFILLILLVTFVNFLTEITSNLATTAMILPILVSISAAINVNPYFLLVGATLAASCAFMLPVATPPNAVVFGSGYLKIEDMIKKGVVLNVISIIAVTLFVYFILPYLWDFSVFEKL